MQFLLDIPRLLASIAIAFCAGKLIAKIKLPSILGWLIAGMIIGPHALNLLGTSVLDAPWFHVAESVFECIFGLMIGTELIWKKMKKSGPQIVVTTITESLGTFLVVTLVFGIIFWLTGVPLYLAFMFGGIALATAPAPSLSVVRDLKADGPVTRTLIPMAALDDLVAALVFFLVISSLCHSGKSHGGVIRTVIVLYMFSTFLAAVIAVIASMMFPVFSTIIPVFRMESSWGIVNTGSIWLTRLSVVLPQIAGNLSFAIIVLMGFIRSLPVDLEEAAYLEGYNVYQIFFRIIMPLAKPSFATVGIFTFLWSYNDLFLQMFFLRSKKFFTITRLLNEISSQAGTNYGLMVAAVVMVVIPVLVVYIFLQNYIIKGMTAGAVKG